MLNPNAQKWVDALRSGKYEQVQHSLSWDGRYCCLGVACELAIKDGVSLVVEESEKGISSSKIYSGEENILPCAVVAWLGLQSPDGAYLCSKGEDHILTTLTTKNDNGASFSEIADIIESEPEGLFA